MKNGFDLMDVSHYEFKGNQKCLLNARLPNAHEICVDHSGSRQTIRKSTISEIVEMTGGYGIKKMERIGGTTNQFSVWAIELN
jgi:hypothetical protein